MLDRHVRVRVAGTYAEATVVRQILTATAGGLFDRPTLVRLEIALTEALHNVIRHGYAGSEAGEIEVAFTTRDDRLVIEIADRGTPMPESASGLLRCPAEGLLKRTPEVAALPEGGLGIPILREVLDDVSYRREGARNVLTLTKRTASAVASPDPAK